MINNLKYCMGSLEIQKDQIYQFSHIYNQKNDEVNYKLHTVYC